MTEDIFPLFRTTKLQEIVAIEMALNPDLFTFDTVLFVLRLQCIWVSSHVDFGMKSIRRRTVNYF